MRAEAVTSFAVHFTPQEFARVSVREPSALEWEYAARLSQLLEVIRHGLGDHPIVVTSWLRSAGAHATGQALDFRPPRKISQRAVFDGTVAALRNAGIPWGELIFYPFSDWHVHMTLYPLGGRGEVLIANATETEYMPPTADLVARIPTTPSLIPPAAAAPTFLAVLGVGTLAAALGGLLS